MDSKLLKRLAFLSFVLVPFPGCSDDGEQSTTLGDDDTSDGGDDDDDNNDDDNDDDNADDNADDASTTDPTDATETGTVTVTDTDPTDPDSSSTDPTDATESSTDPTDASESSSGDTAGSTTDTDTGVGDCTELTISTDLLAATGNVFGIVQPDLLGDPDVDDFIQFEFYTDEVGTFDLSVAPNDNYATCEQCVRVLADEAAVQYYQAEGSIEIDDDPTDGTFSGTLTGVRLIEVTIDEDFVSTPVDGGGCIVLTDGAIATAPVPDEWTCNPAYYSDNDCDCGCGVLDPTCIDATVESCDFCNDTGSCSEDADSCPGTIDPEDNSTCV